MTRAEPKRSGGCACGAVRFKTFGEPVRGGLCHCMTCRKAHAAAFNPFLVFTSEQVEIQGEMKAWESSPGYVRWFCPQCGSRVVGGAEGDQEISLGSFDEPGQFAPQYESWVIRKEPWMPQVADIQFEQNRVP
ncbi:GFA family protein [Phenylobacterium deserti]|uniref:GFA family protein n=1 Tax=Phenylobacterium deserti TaxID=1914756 RepID=A0A328ABZ7_9CAUL|nr:GFA family protein [Phenylobacterium deserti]RAK52323.1 GFA family protein [Phenylobacterium deserti]